MTMGGAAPAGPPVAALIGPTASGKTRVALDVAGPTWPGGTAGPARRPIELVSVDSMAVYRGMDIGTAKPSPSERGAVPLHLVDLVEADEDFTVQQFQAAGRRSLAAIAERGHGALLVGGTGLHLRALIDDLTFPGRYPEAAASLWADLDRAGPEGSGERATARAALHARLARFDAVAASRIEAANERRLVRALEVVIGSGRPFSSFGPGLDRYPPSRVTLFGIRHPVEVLDVRIADRFHRLIELGFLDEVRALVARPGGLSRTARQALGYRELLSHLEDGVPLDEAVASAIQRTRTFSRRQMAWFRRDPRIVWMDPGADLIATVTAHFEQVPAGPASMGDWSPAPRAHR